MKMTGAEILIECLKREGVELIFGYPGGTVIDIYDALYHSDLKHVLTRHEQGAVHAADGYARATGEVGVVLATSGPGATNLVTGIANANIDSVPLVIITGQVAGNLIGTDAFQEADITGITMPISKHNYLVKDIADLPRIVKEAFHIANTGRPGPVLVDLPKDIQQTKAEFYYPEKVDLIGYKPTYSGHPRQIKLVAQALAKAKRPVLYIGGGVVISRAEQELAELVRIVQAPVTSTLMGLSGFPSEDPLFCGMLGMHGTAYANLAVMEADLLVAIGARFDDRVTGRVSGFAPKARVVHIDIDPAEIGKNVRVDIPVVGDVNNILTALLRELNNYQVADKDEWLQQLAEWKQQYPLTYQQDSGIKPQYVIEQIFAATGGDAIIATDVGQHQMWTAQYYRFKHPRSLLSSGGLGTMGFGFPAALGAQFGKRDQTVFCISGDGSFQMNIQELATAKTYGLPVKIVILNNNALGMVRQWQDIMYGGRYSSTIWDFTPDFVKVAEAYGIRGMRIEKPEAVKPALEAALEHNGPVLMEFMVEQDENVMPMVLPGKTLNDMLHGGDE